MNKKIKNIFKILAVTAGCLMFASFSPSLDGRAVVVDKGVFPQGLFAKTVGYLPGDVISVTNIAGDATVDILVIGALDPSEGVAIMLSPEAAEAMGIDSNANNIVKITKRSGQDDRVFGNAVISKSAAEIDDFDDEEFESIGAEQNSDAFDNTNTENEEPEELEEEPAEEEATEEEAEEPETEIAEETEETPEEAEVPEEVEEPAEEEAFEEEAVEEEEEEEEAEEEFAEEEFEEEAPAEETPAEEDVPEAAEEEAFEDETPEELEEAAEEEAFEEDKLDELPAEEEALEEESVEEEPEEFEEETETEAEEDLPAEETAEEDIPAEEGFEEEALDEDAPDALPEETEETAEIEEETPAAEAFEADELEDLPVEKEAEPEVSEETTEETETDEYEAIVLVPADSNPPENEEDEVEDVIAEDDIDAINEEITLTPLEEEKPAEPEKAEPAPKAVTSYDKYMVPSLKDLESGKYYIQIAVYSSEDNILDVINKYGTNYPITIVPMAGGSSKQILIGPVTMDEYKVVLERFKSYGFKDAFLRKVR